jgi:hypothetical protein
VRPDLASKTSGFFRSALYSDSATKSPPSSGEPTKLASWLVLLPRTLSGRWGEWGVLSFFFAPQEEMRLLVSEQLQFRP